MLTLVRRPSATRPTAAVAAVAVAAVAVAKDVVLFLCNRLSQDDAAKVQTVTTERVSTTTGYENCGTMVRQQHRLQKTPGGSL